MKTLKKQFFATAFFVLFLVAASAQYTTNKVTQKQNAALLDSLKHEEYEDLLPIWGQKVLKKGFNLPYSAGLSVNYLYQSSALLINNLQVGFNDGPLYDLDQIIRFNNATATSNGVNLRPDIWLFPFLNIYGILARSNTSTAINCGVWIPDSSTWHQILSINTKASFKATTYGFGLTPTVGIAGFFFALDANFTWSDIAELEKPAFVFVLGPRIGKNFTFRKNPQRNIAVWIGGFRVQINSGTTGSLPTSSIFPVNEWSNKIDTGYMKVANAQKGVNTWWSGLTPVEQKNPVNIAKYNAANTALSTAGAVLDAASQAVTNASQSTIHYSLDKTQKEKWNFLIGSQFQLNKSWMIRAEYGFLGTRQQFLGGIQYRFGL